MILPPPHPVYPSLDFETRSEAGFVWDEEAGKWTCLPNAPQGKKGLPVVGAAVYAEHPSTEVTALSYDLLDGRGVQRWRPGNPDPLALLQHVLQGGLLAGWNTAFEHWVWNKVCVVKYGWPPLPLRQLRCTMARCRAHSGPGALAAAAIALNWPEKKNPDGKRLLDKFSIPRNPTKSDPRKWILVSDDPVDAEKLYEYCDQDVATESAAASRLPALSDAELEYWLTDQEINYRGVKIDMRGVEDCIAIIDQAHEQYNAELFELTGEAVEKASELDEMKLWLHGQGVHTDSLDEENIERLLTLELPPAAKRALQIRQAVGSAAVKKAYAMRNTVASDGRLHDLFMYHAARTGRFTGNGPQPTNLPNSGPEVHRCACGVFFGARHKACPECGAAATPIEEWGAAAAEYALTLIRCRSLHLLEWYFGEGMAVVSGCLRSLFIAEDGYDLIGTDYNSIEAVVLAELAGEEWRREVFRTHGKIYEMSAARIAGIPFEEFMTHAGYTVEQLQQTEWWTLKPENKGKHHPLRKTIGKVAELACFGANTLVLTDRGYVEIVGVLLTDKLWDGEAWVSHEGVVSRRKEEVLNLDGVLVTSEHPIASPSGIGWDEAADLYMSDTRLQGALRYAGDLLPSRSHFEIPGAQYIYSWGEHPVYDILNVGPRHRFTIKTNSGHLLVHNSGYQGWVGAWKNFGADEFMTDDEMVKAILAWRDASPAIVEFWGGQFRREEFNGRVSYRPEYYGVEGAAVQAIQHPGHRFEVRGLGFVVRADVLYIQLLSGREMAYHKPRLGPGRYRGNSINYEGWNTNPKNGPKGWVRMETWGGRIVENLCQATARDLLMPALVRLERAGYRVVLHVYDEVVVEVLEGVGSIAEVERIMEEEAPWAKGWPIRASGGWRGKRFRK